MKVLHVYRTYFPETQGGLEEVIRQICLNTRHLGVESRVFTLSRNAQDLPIELEEADVYQVQQHAELSSCSISLTGFRRFRECVQWADIVQYHFPWPFADILYFCAPKNRPTLLTYHSDIVRQRMLNMVYQPLMNRFLGAVDRIVCTSPNYFATSDVLSRFQEKVEVIPIGVNKSQYLAEGASSITPMVSDYFLFVGVLRYYKGLHILLDAIVDAPYKVIIVGSGPIEKRLQRQAEELQLSNVVFTGRISDAEKVALLKNAKAIVFPSYLRSEAFGVTLLEGAMFGKPLISTEVGSGTSHVNVHKKTGLVVAPGSARALRSAMDKLHDNPDLAEEMGNAAEERYQTLFTGRLMGERYHKIYQELFGSSGTPDASPVENAHRI